MFEDKGWLIIDRDKCEIRSGRFIDDVESVNGVDDVLDGQETSDDVLGK